VNVQPRRLGEIVENNQRARSCMASLVILPNYITPNTIYMEMSRYLAWMTAIGSLADSMSRRVICLDVILERAVRPLGFYSKLLECDKE
jgi:hypothetical protein